ARQAELNACDGVAVDHAGNLVIGDTLNNRVRVVAASTGTFYGQHMKAGDIYTIAGEGPPGFAGDGGPATKAWLCPAAGVWRRPGGRGRGRGARAHGGRTAQRADPPDPRLASGLAAASGTLTGRLRLAGGEPEPPVDRDRDRGEAQGLQPGQERRGLDRVAD